MKKLFILVPLIICFTSSAYAQVIKIGAVYSFTGPLAVYGEDGKRGVEVALEEINSGGGMDGKKVEIIYEDDGGTPAGAVSAVQKLINIDKVPAIAGTLFTSLTQAVAPILEQKQIVLISPTTSASALSKWKYVFRIAPTAEIMSKVVMEYAYKELKLRKIASLFYTTEAGYAWDKGATEGFEKLGGSVLIHETYPQGTTDFRTPIAKIKALNPEAMSVNGTWREVVALVKQMKESNMATRILGSSTLEEPAVINLLGKDSDVITYSIQAVPKAGPSKTALETLMNKYKAKYDKVPGIVGRTSYDCIRMIALGYKRGGGTGEGIQRELSKLRNFPGADGEISYRDENRHPLKTIAVKTIKDGQFVPVGFESMGE